ncbi:plasmid mobilization relaxosome protein MobC [Pseudolactococcus yaeyamensis]
MPEKNRYRDKSILIMVTQEEKEFIKNKMAAAKMWTLTNYIRKQALYGAIVTVNFDEYREILGQFGRTNYELNMIGRNINQIAKHTNENDETQQADILNLQNEVEALKNIYAKIEKDILDTFKKHLKSLEQD